MDKKRPVLIHLEQRQLEKLREEKSRTGAPIAEIIRRIIDRKWPPSEVA